jgi:hypothetical protein
LACRLREASERDRRVRDVRRVLRFYAQLRGVPMIEIAIKNLSTVVSDAELAHALPAFQTQVSRDFFSTWFIDAKLHLVPKTQALLATQWQLVVFDDADGAGYLGYHDVSARGTPLGKVFAKTTIEDGGLWSVTFSHELLEMLLDPWINLTVADPSTKRSYSYEACDAVEADDLGYKIGDVHVSDFVKPSYFETDVTGVTKGRSFCNHVKHAFELAPGGYASFVDWATGEYSQIDARKPGHREGRRSRFGRRQLAHHERRVSTAD